MAEHALERPQRSPMVGRGPEPRRRPDRSGRGPEPVAGRAIAADGGDGAAASRRTGRVHPRIQPATATDRLTVQPSPSSVAGNPPADIT